MHPPAQLAPRPRTWSGFVSPLPTDPEGEHAFGEVRVPELVRPNQVEAMILVGEIRAVQEHLEVLVDLVGERCVHIFLRSLVLLQADDASNAILVGPLRTVVVRD